MGNPCCKIVTQPTVQEPTISKVKKSSMRQKRTSSQESSLSLGSSYRHNTIEEIKLKQINPQYLCRKSKIIPEISSMYHRDTEYSGRWSNICGGHYETNADVKDSVILQVFQQKYLPGREVNYGDTIILRNLKQSNYLSCKYQKHTKFDKKNLVKLEEELTDQNEMYLTWKIIKPSEQRSNKEASCCNNIRQTNILKEKEKVILQHVSTGCFLEANKNVKISQKPPINLGLLVQCGQPNKIVNDNQWELELLETDHKESRIAVNTLFKLRHCETLTYLSAIIDQVCCLEQMLGLLQVESINSRKNDKLGKNTEENEKKINNSTYLNEQNDIQQVALPNNESLKISPSLRNSQDKRQEQIKIHQLIGQDDDQKEQSTLNNNNNNNNYGKHLKYSHQEKNNHKNIDQQSQSQQVESYYDGKDDHDDDNMSNNNVQDVDEIQDLLNKQINNQLFRLNMLTEITAKEEKDKLKKQLEIFQNAVFNSDIWYVSEVVEAIV